MDDYMSKPLDPRQMERSDESLSASRPRAQACLPAAALAETPWGESARTAPGAPFDVDELLYRCLGDPAFMGTILVAFRNRAATMLQQLEHGLAARDARIVARVTHGIKGAAANLSAQAVRDLAAELEDLANAGCLDEARQYQDELRARLQECVDYIPRAVSHAAAAAKKEGAASCES